MKNIFSLTFLLLIAAIIFAQNGVPGACGTNHKNPSPLNGSTFLGMTYNHSECGLNYVEAHQIVETRYNASALPQNMGSGLPATLVVTGLPNCNTILQAYLWYNVSYQEASPPATTVNFTNTIPATSNIPATNIGIDQDKCWLETGTVNYRADVTAGISGNGNYIVNITGLSNPDWEIDGMELIIIYKDNGATYQGSFVIWDGCITMKGLPSSQTMTGFTACAAGANAKAFTLSSDHQDNVGGNLHPTTLNGATSNFPNAFWCFDIANTTVTSGQTSASYGMDGPGNDCYDWSIMGLYYQTTSCVTCTPSAVSLTVTPTPSTCGAPNGSAIATATTSNPPLTYSWSTGATTSAINNLAAGSYTCTVTSATSCSIVQTFTITTSVGPAVTFTTTPSICNASNGSATLTASGGSAPYTYGWITTPAQISPTASGLMAGTYSVLVGDASGCSATYTVAVPLVVNTFSVTPAQTNVKCFGSNNGSANATPSGGAAPYSYAWSTTPAQTTPSISNISAGNYSVTITDANGCTKTATFIIMQPAALTTTTSVVNNTKCHLSSDGNAATNPSGGTAPYIYGWTPTGQNTQTASGLMAGTYSAVVTDSSGCIVSSPVIITQPTAISLTQTVANASCGVSNGSASVSATGGTGAYTYLWLTSPVQITPTVSNLASGIYTVLVTDANGCNQSMPVNVSAAGPPTALFTNNPDTVNLLDAVIYVSDHSINASTWLWNFGDPNNPTTSSTQNPSHTYSDTGVYCITLIVTDPGGVCKDTTTHCLKVESPYTFYIPNCFTPNGDGFNEIFLGEGTYIKSFHILIFDRWGNKIFESYDILKGWDGKVQGGSSGSLVQEDVYVWKINIVDSNDKKHDYIGRVTMIK